MQGQRDILVFVAEKLDKYRIPYLLTGSFAVSYYGYPRATHDIDFIIEISPKNSQSVINLMNDLGKVFVIDKNQVKNAINKKEMLDIFDTESGVKVDFWVVKTDFDKNKFDRSISIKINKQKVILISCEDLILTKLLWCKKIRSDRHLGDCAGIWKIQKSKIDKKYLHFWTQKLEITGLFKEIQETEY